MIRSRRTPQWLGIGRLLFRAHGAGIKLNPRRRHFSSLHLFSGPLFPADAPGARSLSPSLCLHSRPVGPFCPSLPEAAHPRTGPACARAPSALCGAVGEVGEPQPRAEPVVAARGAPRAREKRGGGEPAARPDRDEAGGGGVGTGATVPGADGGAIGSRRGRAPGAARSVRGPPLRRPAGTAGAAGARDRAAAPLPAALGKAAAGSCKRRRRRAARGGPRASPRPFPRLSAPRSPCPRRQGSRGEGGRGVRRGGLAGSRGPAFPLRIPGAMRGGDGPEPAGLAP